MSIASLWNLQDMIFPAFNGVLSVWPFAVNSLSASIGILNIVEARIQRMFMLINKQLNIK
ncbi:hypothetical protein AW40_07260 [Kosakonia radicincitans UMEnt01/12]|nr:hypothetical protein AW40_07260 [Kosakonia radicincitans UMEnt01/12]